MSNQLIDLSRNEHVLLYELIDAALEMAEHLDTGEYNDRLYHLRLLHKTLTAILHPPPRPSRRWQRRHGSR